MRHVTLITAILATTACSDPKAATEANFKAAVQAFLSSEKSCISLPRPLPAAFTERDPDYESHIPIHDELVSVGFLSKEPFEQEMEIPLSLRALFYAKRRPTEMVAGIRYSVTDAGMAAGQVGDPPERPSSFCYGQYRVVGITNFSEPTSALGQIVSTVHFKWEATDIAEWASSSEILQNAFPDLARDLVSHEEPRTGTATVVLTGKGWVHRSLFGN